MEQPRKFDCPRDEFRAAAQRERELNEALAYLDRAIGHLANQDAPSRWIESQRRPIRRPLMPRLTQTYRWLAAFGIERRNIARPTAAMSP